MMCWFKTILSEKKPPLCGKRGGDDTGLECEALAGDLRNFGKGLLVGDGEFGEDLPVDLDTGLAQTVYERAVGHVVETGPGIDPGDPETAEITFPCAAIAISVFAGPVDGLGG